MSGFLDTLKSWLPGLLEKNRTEDYFRSAWQMEHENTDIYKLLIPIIKYNFLQDVTRELLKEQEADGLQLDIELASNQVDKPAYKPFKVEADLPSEYHLRTHLVNMLLENNKTLGAIYLHLSYSETIAQSIHYERLKTRKEQQISRIQDLILKLN